jgi:glyoxylase-like metal-dependent hydrolase (beta-lactamase superfamily II)
MFHAPHTPYRYIAIASLFLAVTINMTSSIAFGQAQADATDRLHQTLRNLALPIGKTGVEVQMSGTEFAKEQARDPEVPIAEIPTKQRLLLYTDGRYLLETDEFFPGSVEFLFRTVGSRTGSTTFDLLKWRSGTELLRGSPEEAQNDYGDLLLLCPALLATDALRHSLVIDSANSSGKTLKASYKDSLDRSVSLVVDHELGTIVSVEVGKQHYRYLAWHSAGGLLQPSSIEGFNGQIDVAWKSLNTVLKTAPSGKDFEIPPGYVEAPAQPKLALTPLGNGAYRVDGTPSGYHTGVVVGSDCIALFDPSVSKEEAKTVKQLVEEAFPGRPIRYVILSHAHGDHIHGLPIYFGNDVKIIAGAGAQIAIQRQFPTVNLAQLKQLELHADIDLGGTKLQLYPINSSHASTMLVAYHRESHTIFEGDLLSLPDLGPVQPSFEGADELLSLITTNHLIVDTIVGIHGRSASLRDLEESLELRHKTHTL